MTNKSVKSDWKTVGLDLPKKHLSLAIESGNLAHAYLLSGPSAIGKTTFAIEVSEKLLGSSVVSSPDAWIVDQTEAIGVEQIRDLKARFSLSSFGPGKKVAVIASADAMTLEAANALLKLIEEPNKETVIFLISNKHGGLPETLRSRCQQIICVPLIDSDIGSLLDRLEISKKLQTEIIQLVHGRPGLAYALATNQETMETYRDWDKLLLANLEGSLGDRLSILAPLSSMEAPDLMRMLEYWEIALYSDFTSKTDLSRALFVLETSRTRLQRNESKKLILDSLALQLQPSI